MTKSKARIPISRIRSIKHWPTELDRETNVRVEPCMPQTQTSKRLLLGNHIGRGGMSVVEEIFDANLLKKLARKSIAPEKAHDEEACGHFIEEAQITAQLDHPNIVPVHELSLDDQGRLFFTMKMVRGKTFSDVLAQVDYRERSEKQLFEQLQIFLKVCDAVAFAHSRGVIHRDLKPDNIMVGEFGEVYLMDWGLARLKQWWRPSKKDREMSVLADRRRFQLSEEEGIVNATILYMAPEQAQGKVEAIDERTDVFGLGAILYEVLTHLPPYVEESTKAIVSRALLGDVYPPQEMVDCDLPERLCGIAMKALNREPSKRYSCVADLKQDVEQFLQSGWQFARRVFEPGDLIVEEGRRGRDAYVITVGRCQVFRKIDGKKVVLENLGVGDVFGELAVFTKRPRAASVEAVDKVTVMEITQQNFRDDLGMSFWLGLFAKALGERLIEADNRVVELERKLKQLGEEC